MVILLVPFLFLLLVPGETNQEGSPAADLPSRRIWALRYAAQPQPQIASAASTPKSQGERENQQVPDLKQTQPAILILRFFLRHNITPIDMQR